MKTDPRFYQSFLLRLWREHPKGEWRAILQNVSTAEQVVFANLETLFVHLCALTGDRSSLHPVDRLKPGTKKEEPQ